MPPSLPLLDAAATVTTTVANAVDAAVAVPALLPDWLSPEKILEWLGPWAIVGVAAIIFAECGLLIGFFLPGDSLIFLTGVFIANGYISANVWVVAILLSVMAVLGNLTGYWIGAAVGPKLFDKPDSRLFKREYVDKAHEFFERYGPPAIVLARFVPIVRTFITAVAGVARMDFRVYMTYSAVGGVLWAGGMTLAGYFLGGFPIIKDNVELVLILVVLISAVPIFYEYGKHHVAKRREAKVGADAGAASTAGAAPAAAAAPAAGAAPTAGAGPAAADAVAERAAAPTRDAAAGTAPADAADEGQASPRSASE